MSELPFVRPTYLAHRGDYVTPPGWVADPVGRDGDHRDLEVVYDPRRHDALVVLGGRLFPGEYEEMGRNGWVRIDRFDDVEVLARDRVALTKARFDRCGQAHVPGTDPLGPATPGRGR